MPVLFDIAKKPLFPCPLCGQAREVRKSKKGKPYLVCDGCGVQLFIRAKAGIALLKKLAAEAQAGNIWDRLARLGKRYRKKCPECGTEFWVRGELIKTHWLDGHFVGYRCPEPDCRGVVGPEGE